MVTTDAEESRNLEKKAQRSLEGAWSKGCASATCQRNMGDPDALRVCMLSDLRDATESTRVWKLKCVQAEAELRALKTP
eukprot:803393-Amphidinium_carterae.1